MSAYDQEGRTLVMDLGDLTLVNWYFPSGSSGEIRQEVKMKFLDEVLPWMQKLKAKRKKLIIVGDYNIAHTELDIHNPKGNKCPLPAANPAAPCMPANQWEWGARSAH